MAFDLGALRYAIGLDDTQLEKGLRDSKKRLEAFSKTATNVGKNLSLKLTLPLTLLGGAALKTAADMETYENKLLTAADGADNLDASIQRLITDFGLSAVQATKLTANTADLLRGFGATGEEAVATSTRIQELAAALSAYSGVSIDQASEAFTKAVVGETEGLKQLGIVIRQTDIEAELLAQGLGDLTGEARQLAAAEATLTIATRQSQDAINSFAENQDQLNFKTNRLKGQLQDLAASWGEQLIPAAVAVTDVVGDIVQYFTDLDDTTKRVILVMGGLAAAAGPVAFGIGKISSAMIFLAANPIVAAIAGVAALTTGIVLLIDAGNKWVDKQNEIAEAGGKAWREGREEIIETAETYDEAASRIQGLSEEMFNAAKETGNFTLALQEAERAASLQSQIKLLTDELESLGNTTVSAQRAIDRLNATEADFWGDGATEAERLNQAIKIITDSNGRLEDSIMKATTAQQQQAIYNAIAERDAEALQEALSGVGAETDEIIALQEELNALRSGDSIRDYINEQERLAQAERQRLADAEAAEKARAEREQLYIAARAEVLDILTQEKDEYDQIQEQIDRLQQTPWANGELERDRLAAIETLRERQQDLLDEEEERINEVNDAYIDRLEERSREEEDRLRERMRLELETEDLTQEGRAAIVAFWEAEIEALRKAAADEAKQKEDDRQAKIQALREEWANRRFEQEASEIEKLERRRDEAIEEAGEDEETIFNIKKYYAEEIRRIESALEKEKRDEDAKQLADEQAAAEEAVRLRTKIEQDSLMALAQIAGNRLYILNQRYQEEIQAARDAGASTLAIEQRYAIERERLLEEMNDKAKDETKDTAESIVENLGVAFNYIKSISSSIIGIFDEISQRRIDAVNSWLDTELGALDIWREQALADAGIVTETRIEELQRELEEAKATGNEETIAAAEEALAREQIEQEYLDKKAELEKQAALKEYQIELEMFRLNKAAALINIGISTAEAVIKAFAQLGPAAAAVAPFLIAIGAAQAALVISQPEPPRPQLAAGGLITSRAGGVDVTVGEGRDDELVLPLNDDVYKRFISGMMEAAGTTYSPQSSSTGDGLTIVIEGLGEIVIDKMQQRITDRKIRIPASSIVRR